jgi:hypothetical protein
MRLEQYAWLTPRPEEIRWSGLQAFDSNAHVYRYTLERASMPLRNYTGELRIDPACDRARMVTWSAEFDLVSEEDRETVESVRRFLHAGIESLQRQFGNRLQPGNLSVPAQR